MNHCYIFDHTDCQIYHIEIPEDITNERLESILYRDYGLKDSQISYMITEHKRSIIDI